MRVIATSCGATTSTACTPTTTSIRIRRRTRRTADPVSRRRDVRAERRRPHARRLAPRNVDRFVERMYREVHALKPTSRSGISPFGIWRPGNPTGVNGLDAYATIYADSRKWLQQGWVDYLAPQLYWAIAAPQQSYPALLDWWLGAEHARPPRLAGPRGVSRERRHVERVRDERRSRARSSLTRQRPAGTGHLLYNTTWTLKRNGGAVAASLAADLYRDARDSAGVAVARCGRAAGADRQRRRRTR